jgi:predicted transcriptional regulator
MNNITTASLSSRERYNLLNLPLHKKYRSGFEIIALVLEAAKKRGATRFSIMKQAGTNFKQLDKYLQSLTDIGFIEADVEEHRVLYRASEKGLNYLAQYYVLLGMLLGASTRNELTNVIHEVELDVPHKQKQPTRTIVTRIPVKP